MTPQMDGLQKNDENVFKYDWILPLLEESKTWNAVKGLRKVVKVKSDSGKSDIGFVGKISKVNVLFDNGTIHKLILKTPDLYAIQDAIDKTFQITPPTEKLPNLPEYADPEKHKALIEMFNCEIDFYRSSLKEIELKTPQVYFTQQWSIEKRQMGLVIMDDLSINSSITAIYDTLSTNQVSEVLSQVVLMQTLASTQNEKWRTRFKLTDSFVKRFPNMKELFLLMGQRTKKLQRLVSKLAHLFDDTTFWEYIYRQVYSDCERQGVLCHGDLWTYNIMWTREKSEERSSRLTAILDWQNVHEGSCAEDLSRLIVFNCNRQVRKECEEFVIPKFHEMMVKRCEALCIPPLYTLQELKRSYRIHKTAHILNFTFLAPVLDAVLNEEQQGFDSKNSIQLTTRVEDALEEAWEIFKTDLPQFLKAEN